jgi:hypothetical protein
MGFLRSVPGAEVREVARRTVDVTSAVGQTAAEWGIRVVSEQSRTEKTLSK